MKDSSEAVEFMTLFAKVKEWCDDDPGVVERMAADDEGFCGICGKLNQVVVHLQMAERRTRSMFALPVDPAFLEAWRDFGERYASAMAGLFLREILGEQFRVRACQESTASLAFERGLIV